MRRFDTKVLGLEPVARDYFRLSFRWADGLPPPLPGQFLTLATGSGFDPVLRRPFALAAWDPSAAVASVIFQRRGRGTEWLAGLRSGDTLDVLGPLGKGFRLPGPGVRPLLLGGGIGLGPMLYLAETLVEGARRSRHEHPILVLGYRSADFVPSCPLPQGTVVCTDDGTAGYHGSVLDYLATLADALPPELYACGPLGMMRGLDRLARSRQWSWQAATEQWMACGVGACMGCVLPLRTGGFKRCCEDGPVFAGQEIDWERLA